MKQLIPNYTFAAAGKTVTLTDFTTVRLDRLLLIVNVTRNVIYYNFADATLGATVATNVITLTNVSTAGHADADKIEVFYDNLDTEPDYQAPPGRAVTLQNAAGATGNGTAMSVTGMGTVMMTVTISATATVLFEASEDGSTFVSLSAINQASGAVATGTTVTGVFATSVSGFKTFRARISSFGSGTVTVTAHTYQATLAPLPPSLTGGIAGQVSGNRQINNAIPFFAPQFLRDSNSTEATWIAARANFPVSVLASASRAVTTNGADQTNYNGKGVMLVLNVTVEAAAETLSLKIQGKDSISSNYFDIVDFGVAYNAVADAPTVTRAFVAYPDHLDADYVGIAGNGTAGKQVTIPVTWRPVVTHSASGSWTYSLSAVVLMS